jgi:hypothetical protein
MADKTLKSTTSLTTEGCRRLRKAVESSSSIRTSSTSRADRGCICIADGRAISYHTLEIITWRNEWEPTNPTVKIPDPGAGSVELELDRRQEKKTICEKAASFDLFIENHEDCFH